MESAKRKGSESSVLMSEVESFFRGDNTAKFNSLRVNDHLINIQTNPIKNGHFEATPETCRQTTTAPVSATLIHNTNSAYSGVNYYYPRTSS